MANTVLKVIPRVTIAQTTITDTVHEAGVHPKDNGDSKTDSKDQKPVAEYPKLTHGISINIANVGITNSTQLPRIAEEKDSPTGSKSDDYSSRSISKSEHNVDAACSEPIKELKDSSFVMTRKGVLNAVERLQSASESAAAADGTSSFRVRKPDGIIPQRKFSVVESKLCNKNWFDTIAEKDAPKTPTKPTEFQNKPMSTLMQRKASVFDMKMSEKNWTDTSSEGRKVLKRYKVDSETPSTSNEKNSTGDNKKNN